MKKFIHKTLIKPISDMKLKRKLLLSYFLLIVIPFGIFTFFSDYRVSNTIETLVKFSAKQSFEQSADFLSYKLEKITDVLNVILSDKNINETLAKNPATQDIHMQIKDMGEMSTYLKSFYNNNNDIFGIKLYVNDEFIYSTENNNFLSLKTAKNSSWYKTFTDRSSNVFWLSIPTIITQNKVSAIKPIQDSKDYSHLIGLVRIDILESNLNTILKKASSTSKSITYIQNSNNEIISSSNSKIKAELRFDNNFLSHKMHNGFYFDVFNLKSEKILLACQTIPKSDWTMVSITPYNEILSGSKDIRNDLLKLFIVIGTAAYIIAYIISFSITRRIRVLINKMRNIKNGKFSNEIVSTSKDEIGELLVNFNEMAERLSFLIKEQFRIGQEAKNFELIALQAQINPHFLYNTLDLINWTAINNNVPEIAATVKSLSKFYKLSLSKGSNIITIKDELEHVKLYMDLQNRRYEHAFNFQTEIDEACYEYTTIKIILQPIIENCIIHGILQKKVKKGLIKLKVYTEATSIIFIVQDDGVGMPLEKMETILSTSTSNDTHGYGIRNIDERIKLFYGDMYGLSYESAIGEGTTVIIKIPMITPV